MAALWLPSTRDTCGSGRRILTYVQPHTYTYNLRKTQLTHIENAKKTYYSHGLAATHFFPEMWDLVGACTCALVCQHAELYQSCFLLVKTVFFFFPVRTVSTNFSFTPSLITP